MRNLCRGVVGWRPLGIIRRRMKRVPAVILAVLALAACNGGLFATPSPTAPPPTTTPTSIPLAARVHGEGIVLADFEDEVARFEAAQALLGTDLASLGDYRRQVLQALIDRLLLTQGAVEAGGSFKGGPGGGALGALAPG